MRAAVLIAFYAGCGFSGPTLNERSDGGPGGDGTSSSDGDVPTVDARGAGDDAAANSTPPLHLGPTDGQSGTAPLTLTGTVTIDTTGPTLIGATLPAGDTFDVRPQLGGGPGLAVLHVGGLGVASGAMVRIIGTRPLVIVAAAAVTIDGTLDLGARGAIPGAGGALPGTGTGAGAAGTHGSNDSDSGGGGAGFGKSGASGGAIATGGCSVAGGAAGQPYGAPALAQLVGGAGGGSSSGTACPLNPGGAGGGALQISSATSIAISATGRINAGGGGGGGGTDCGQSDVNSGAGGGSGGAIVLQAPSVANAGVISANGGGGGGSSSTGNGSASAGNDGQLGTAAAIGGIGPRADGGAGGATAALATAGGGAMCGANGAGGGGGVGRIAISMGFSGGTVSPTPDTTLPP